MRDLLSPFEIVRLWAALHVSKSPASKDQLVGKWVAWVRKPSLAPITNLTETNETFRLAVDRDSHIP